MHVVSACWAAPQLNAREIRSAIASDAMLRTRSPVLPPKGGDAGRCAIRPMDHLRKHCSTDDCNPVSSGNKC